MNSSAKWQTWLRFFYHRLPVSQRAKWRLREQLSLLLVAVQTERSLRGILRAIASAHRPVRYGDSALCDNGCEHVLARMLDVIAAHAQVYGPVRHWIALPFLAAGGAEMVALNICRALRELRPQQSVLLLITDRKLLNPNMATPQGVIVLALDDYLIGSSSYLRKKALLRNLLVAVKPDCFHNINSEVSWQLIMEEGERLQRYTRLYASIFAFQFAPDGQTKIGYAAYYLKKCFPYLSGLLTDNHRFVNDAAQEYQLTFEEKARLHVLYQPCRLLRDDSPEVGRKRLQERRDNLAACTPHGVRRPRVLWAGRLDADKRIDLFLEIVRHCTFADFHVFGQVVLGDGDALPMLPNLSYEGPFSSPLEWLEGFEFDAFLFTSRWEGMPNILIEVGALGIPVIAPTVGGVGELVTKSTGFPLPERPTVSDYEQALRQVIDNPLQALCCADRLYELVLQNHSWKSFSHGLGIIPGYLDQADFSDVRSHCAPITEPSCKHLEPLVSVVVPCYNQGQYLQVAVASALAACRHPLEIIVIDDGSTDARTARYLFEAEQLAPGVVRIHRQNNGGLSVARNTGVALAQGKYIQFLDADDLLAPGKIDAQVAQLQVNIDIDISVCNYLLCDEERAHFYKLEEAIARFDLTIHDFLYRWERGFVIPIHCGLFHRSLLQQAPFDIHARAKEDWLFWTSQAISRARFGYIHGHWAIYRQHQASMRRSYINMGRAWLQAGLKIESMLDGRHPLFFESVVSWFEQCYRTNQSYRTEIAMRQAAVEADSSLTAVTPKLFTTAHFQEEVQSVADAILKGFEKLPDTDKPPLISVVLPVYGHFDYLQECLESIGRQGDVAIEVVCIDDGSPDPRVTCLMRALQNQHPCLIVRTEPTNKGISFVQNAAASLANGEYLAFLDCDDALVPGALEMVGAVLKENPEVDYLFTDRLDVDKTGKDLNVVRYGGYDNLHYSQIGNIATDLIDGMVASHLKIIRRNVYQAVGGCNPIFSGVQDWELALRIAKGHNFYYLPKALYRHRIHDSSVTSSDRVSQFRKTNQVRRLYLEPQRKLSANSRPRRVFSTQDMPISLVELKAAWKKGDVLVANMQGEINLGQINFLREFNSYFDQILWNDPKVPAALYGYLSSEVTLCYSESSFANDHQR
jgi:glycosyltransferase involved in cell wall biosynthesis